MVIEISSYRYMHIPYSYAVGSTHTFAYRTISFTSIDSYIETHTYTQPNKQIQQIQSVHDINIILPSQQMVSNDNDLTAAFRAKAIFMKSWNPASAPSVRWLFCDNCGRISFVFFLSFRRVKERGFSFSVLSRLVEP